MPKSQYVKGLPDVCTTAKLGLLGEKNTSPDKIETWLLIWPEL